MLGALDKLRCEGDSRSDEVLFIRALELDTLTALFTYVFGRIKAMLKERGAYVGAGSECQKLLASAGLQMSASHLCLNGSFSTLQRITAASMTS